MSTTKTLPSLAALFGAAGTKELDATWGDTAPAKELEPIPKGEYVARLDRGDLFHSQSGTPGYKICFVVEEGDHKGRRLYFQTWLTPKAIAYAKRDLAKVGVTTVAQLETPIAEGYVCKLSVVLKQNDEGTSYNEVNRFEVVAFNPPVANPFAPKAEDLV